MAQHSPSAVRYAGDTSPSAAGVWSACTPIFSSTQRNLHLDDRWEMNPRRGPDSAGRARAVTAAFQRSRCATRVYHCRMWWSGMDPINQMRGVAPTALAVLAVLSKAPSMRLP
jgi:hypothetical protein